MPLVGLGGNSPSTSPSTMRVIHVVDETLTSKMSAISLSFSSWKYLVYGYDKPTLLMRTPTSKASSFALTVARAVSSNLLKSTARWS